MSKLFALWTLLALAVCMPALALDDDTIREAIYRVNLGRADDVALLIKKGVPPNQVNEDGVPLLSLAAGRKDGESVNVMKTLLEAGANLNEADLAGQNALFHAAKSGNKEAVTFLLERGISYYATDKRGDIARTIAHREGHHDIVALMDKFVTDQTDKVSQQYKEYNQAVEERYKAIEQRNQEQAKQAEKPPALDTSEDEYLESPAESPEEENDDISAEDLPVIEDKSIEEKRASPEFRGDMRTLSFHSCAFQYWSFCRMAQQTTDLTAEELSGAIEAHRQQILDTRKYATEEYRLTNNYLDRVEKNSKRAVSNQLNDMPSKTYRFEHGVCRMDDLHTRCGLLADAWDQPPPRKRNKADRKKPKAFQSAPNRPKGKQSGGQPARGKNSGDQSARTKKQP